MQSHCSQHTAQGAGGTGRRSRGHRGCCNVQGPEGRLEALHGRAGRGAGDTLLLQQVVVAEDTGVACKRQGQSTGPCTRQSHEAGYFLHWAPWV